MKVNSALAARFRDELFDDVDKVLFTTVVGTRFIDIASHFLRIYGRYTIRKDLDENTFLEECASLIQSHGKDIIEQLRVKRQQLDSLMNYKGFYKGGTGHKDGTTTLVNNFDSTNKNKDASGAYVYEYAESSNLDKALSLSRGANTQTSQKNKSLERKWVKDNIVDLDNPLFVGKNSIDPNKILEKKEINVQETEYQVIKPEKEIIPPEEDKEVYSLLNLGSTGAISNQFSGQKVEDVSLLKSDGTTTSQSETYSFTGFDINTNYSSYVENDAIMRTLRNEIPDLISKFFNIFLTLFRT